METLPGSKTSKREGTSGPVDPRKTNVNFGKADRTLYRTSSQADMVDHFKTGSTGNVASSQVLNFVQSPRIELIFRFQYEYNESMIFSVQHNCLNRWVRALTWCKTAKGY